VQEVNQQRLESLRSTHRLMQTCMQLGYVLEELNPEARRVAKKGLKEWVKEKWVDIGAPKKNGKFQPCGRKKGDGRAYPKCVPLAKANAMTSAQRSAAVRRKRAKNNSTKGKPSYART